MAKKVGIDLGTTYSVVSYVDDAGIITNVESAEGGKTTPSVVFFDPNGTEVVVGEGARDAGAMNPECLVERVKNYMGNPDYRIEMNGTEYSASAVSSLILQKLIKDAETWLGGEEIEGAVITCPAYFGDAARAATRAAGENVTLQNGQKLQVLQIIDEPTAAAIAYGFSQNVDIHKTVLVYDLGGGTFDCTVMKLDFDGDNKKYEVITTAGNHQLGGKDWDACLTEYVIEEFCANTGCDPDEMKADPESKAWFSEKIEKAKIALTNKETTVLTPAFNGAKYKIEITRDKFDELTSGKFQETLFLVDKMFEDKGMNIMTDIDEIILVGGSTRMPQIESGLTLRYNKPITTFDPDKAVSNGAALVASGINPQAAAGTAAPTFDDLPGFGDIPAEDAPTVISTLDGSTSVIIEKCTKSYCMRYFKSGVETYVNLIKKDDVKPAHGTTATLIPGLVLGGGDANGMTDSVGILIMENEQLTDEVDRGFCTEIYEEVPIKLDAPVSANSAVEIRLDVNKGGELSLTLVETATGREYVMIPTRKGGDADRLGMDAASSLSIG